LAWDGSRKEKHVLFGKNSDWLRGTALVCAALILPGDIPLRAQAPAAPQPAAADAPKPIPPDQLDSLVAPIALYPDPLLAQVLAASTYPLEVVQCNRWLKNNKSLKGEALTKAAAQQGWDPSVAALVAFPDALDRLDQAIQWTTDLGNAFLAQQGDVMDAVQRMRKKAKDNGKLETSKEQKVEVQTVESKQVIVIQPSNPEVIYVPSYQPTVVYGAPPPAYAYPPYPYGAVAATAAISFGVGVAMGAMWGGCCHGGYGWNAGWGGNNTINVNNNFNGRYYNNSGNRTNVQGGNRANVGSGNSSWQHNPSHRESVPYRDKQTAQKFGGNNARGNGQLGDRNSGRNSGVGGGRDSGLGGGRDSGLGGGRDSGVGGGRNSGVAGNNRGGGAASRDIGGGGDRVGNRSVDSGSRGQASAFGGGSRERTQASSNRGFSSSRSSGGGGGGGGGGRRSGGGGGGRRGR
jgi:hypothetical protein